MCIDIVGGGGGINKNMKKEKMKAYLAAMMIQLSYAVMFILTKQTVSSSNSSSSNSSNHEAMKPSVLVAYRQVLSTLLLSPCAVFLSYKSNLHRLPWRAYLKIFIVSSFGITLTLNLNLAGLKYASPTFATAMLSAVPVLVFIMSVTLRIERVVMSERHGMAKVLGSLIGLGGAMVFTFYKGPCLFSWPNNNNINNNNTTTTTSSSSGKWIKGSLLVVASEITWSMWLTMQAPLLKQYPGKFRLTFLQIGFSSITSSLFAASLERNLHSWKLGFDINLITILYCAIGINGFCYWVQAWVIEKEGAVFSANFGPLGIILAAIFSTIFLKESLYTGSIVGGAVLIVGLHCFLWGSTNQGQTNLLQQEQMDSVSPNQV